jgi:hypothetical protein
MKSRRNWHKLPVFGLAWRFDHWLCILHIRNILFVINSSSGRWLNILYWCLASLLCTQNKPNTSMEPVR